MLGTDVLFAINGRPKGLTQLKLHFRFLIDEDVLENYGRGKKGRRPSHKVPQCLIIGAGRDVVV